MAEVRVKPYSMYLMSGYLMSVHLTGVCLIDVYLTGVYLTSVHGRISHFGAKRQLGTPSLGPSVPSAFIRAP